MKESMDEENLEKIMIKGENQKETIKMIGSVLKYFIIAFFTFLTFYVVSYNLAGKNTQADIKMTLASNFVKIVTENKFLLPSVVLNIILLVTVIGQGKYYKNRISFLAEKCSGYEKNIDKNKQTTLLNRYGE